MFRQNYCLHRTLVVFVFVFVLIFACSSQNINRIEYFIDTDPGFGNGSSVIFSPNSNLSNLTFAANTSGLSNGLHALYVRSKDQNNLWSLTKSLVLIKSSINTPIQNIVQIEYFIDNDPGFGNATQISFSSTTNLNNVTFSLNTSNINSGLHTLFIRSKDANGIWSLTNRHSFVKSTINTTNVNIVHAEYFIDYDPGFGNAITIPLTPNNPISSLTFNANVDTIKSGLHTLYIRTRDANGNWSLTNKHSFMRVTNVSPSANVVRAEYFIDTDPGFGNAVNIPISSPGTTVSSFTFSADLTTVNNGLHTLFIRTKDANGNWSLTNKHSFVRLANVAPSANIVKAEYFIDTDPGIGNAVNIPISMPAATLTSMTFAADLTTVNNGLHTLYVRTKDANGNWSLTGRHSFYKDQTLTGENIVAAEYFVDNDPGIGNGTVATVTPSSNVIAQNFTANITGVPIGPHTLYVRSKNTSGDWSLTNKINFNKAFIAPIADFTASVTSGCAPLTVNFTDMSQNSPTTWAWDFENNGTTDAITQNPSFTFNTPGNYTVKLSVSNVSGNNTITKTAYITVISNYNTNAMANICSGDSIYLQGQYRKVAGLYHDTLNSSNGCDSIIHTYLNVNPLITPNISINTNLTTACSNDLITFTSSIINGGSAPSYQWQVNGINLGSNSSFISLNNLNNNDVVSCILTSNVSCALKTTDTSNLIPVNILPISTSSISASACNSYTLNSITYTTGGVYNQTLINSVGCDSIITLILTIKNNVNFTKYYTACLGDTVYEGLNAFYQTGVYDNYYTASNGCDSIVTVNLQITDINNTTYISGSSIYTNEPLAAHQWYNCLTNSIIPGATNNYYTPTSNGSYYVVLNYNNCYDTSACINFTTLEINHLSTLKNISIFPNPNTGEFTLTTGLPENETFGLIITNLLGQKIESYTLKGDEINLQLKHLSAGAYLINVQTTKSSYTTSLIIQN